jgi:hypothetical protein
MYIISTVRTRYCTFSLCMILVAQLSVTHVDKGLPLDAPGGGSLSSLARHVGQARSCRRLLLIRGFEYTEVREKNRIEVTDCCLCWRACPERADR